MKRDEAVQVAEVEKNRALEVAHQQREQAARVADRVRSGFLAKGGLVSTECPVATGEQWDYPNGWPPLHWMAVQGLLRYGHRSLAEEVARRFCGTVKRVYEATGRFMEKYDVVDTSREAGGGEYPNQDGFGWTNGVYLALRTSVLRGTNE